jgi:hypothetical protein
LTTASQLLTLYVAYVFLSGWSFQDYYFRSFGLDPRVLEFNFQTTLVKGFTVLFTHGVGLWWAYGPLLALPLGLEAFQPASRRARLLSQTLLLAALVALLFLVYAISAKAGSSFATLNKGCRSRLPLVTFTYDLHPHHGKLLLLQNGTYYVHADSRTPEATDKPQTPTPCAVGLGVLTIFRADQLTDVQIIEPAGGQE